MAFTPATNKVKFKKGTFNNTSAVSVTVNLGFRPKYLVIWFNGSGGSATSSGNGAVRYIYDSSVNPDYGFRAYRTSSNSITINMAKVENSGDTRVIEITSDSFTYKRSTTAAYQGTYNYFAIGQE